MDMAKKQSGDASVPGQIKVIYDRCENIEKSLKKSVKKAKQTHASVIGDIKKFRKQMDDSLDAWETIIITEVNELLQSDLDALTTVLAETRKIIDEMLSLTKDITLYQVKLFDESAKYLEQKNAYKEYEFVGHATLANVFKSETKLGEVRITKDVTEFRTTNTGEKQVPTYIEDIGIQIEDDTFNCDVTGMAATGAHRLIIADGNNKSLKCIDAYTKTLLSQIRLESAPWDVTMVHRGQVAVTIPSDKLIQFVNTPGILREDRIMRVNGECRGIAYIRECLVVSFRNPGKVQIITLTGRVLKNIKLNVAGENIFERPDYVVANNRNGLIYVSDWRKNKVIRLNWKGEVTAVFRAEEETQLAGLALAEDGGVYVSKREHHSIIKLKKGLKFEETVLEEKHGLQYPWCLCFDKEDNVLYVDNVRKTNTISVFELI
ncbi:hypothetical protein ACF0H5_021679 [Mactra antiquata]